MESIHFLLTCVPLTAKALYNSKKHEVDAVLKKHGTQRLVAFGSRARGDARADSDLDLVIEFPAGSSLFDLVHIQDELEQAFGLPVNVLSFGGLKKRLARHVEEDGIVLVDQKQS